MEESYKFAQGQLEEWTSANNPDALCDFLDFMALHVTNRSVIDDLLLIFKFIDTVNKKYIADNSSEKISVSGETMIYKVDKDTILNRKINEVLSLISQDIQRFLQFDTEMLSFIDTQFKQILSCSYESIKPFHDEILSILTIITLVLASQQSFQN